MDNNNQQRLRVNCKVTGKGIMTPDITAEGPDQETVNALILQGIDTLKDICAIEGFLWPGNKKENEGDF